MSKLICVKCSKNINKTTYKIGCTGSCNQWYHRECSGLSESQIDELSKGKFTYLCTTCKILSKTIEEGKSDSAFYDAIENLENVNKLDVCVFAYILKQKDIIINELREKNKILLDQIDLLNKTKNRPTLETAKREKISNVKNTKSSNTITQQSPTNLQESSSTKIRNSAGVSKSPADSDITDQKMSYEMLKVKTKQVCNDYIELGKDEPKRTDVLNGKPKIRKRDIIVGNNEGIKVNGKEVVGVPSFTPLHVYRIDPTLTADELTDLVKVNFPEVKIDKLNSKYPDLYSSFKVNIHTKNFEHAMDPSKWPTGAYVQRFFYLQRKTAVHSHRIESKQSNKS